MTNREKRSARLKAARRIGTHTKEQWQSMKDFFAVCVICEGESGLINLERDHIIPLYQGGSDSIKNIQPLCAKCNARKGADDIDHRTEYCDKHGIEMPEVWV